MVLRYLQGLLLNLLKNRIVCRADKRSIVFKISIVAGGLNLGLS